MSKYQDSPEIIHSTAPIRICDNGGWTDTWFAEYGEIFNIAVSPGTRVRIIASKSTQKNPNVTIHALNYGDRYSYLPGSGWLKHPLLEACISHMPIPEGIILEIQISSQIPPGASTGTSAAISVALLGALDLLSSGQMTPHEIAYTAHEIETEILSLQSGIQDQLCSAYGGINYIRMDKYPEANVTQIDLKESFLRELEQMLVLIYLGKSHSSSTIHEMVIQSLKNAGPDCIALNDLRHTARKSRDALMHQDITELGAAMVENTEAQRRLHPELIGFDAQQVIEVAQKYHALGWKINGAGGNGGSVTILCQDFAETKHNLIHEISMLNASYRSIPINISSQGLSVHKNQGEI